MTADKQEMPIEELINSGEYIIEDYEDMSREDLIEACKAHDAHHEEHHAKDDHINKQLEEVIEWVQLNNPYPDNIITKLKEMRHDS